MKRQTSRPSRRALIASGVVTAGLALTTPTLGASLTPKRDVRGRDFAMTGIRRLRPVARLIGLLGMVLGEQAIEMAKRPVLLFPQASVEQSSNDDGWQRLHAGQLLIQCCFRRSPRWGRVPSFQFRGRAPLADAVTHASAGAGRSESRSARTVWRPGGSSGSSS
jgi:hypothetical protein